MSNRKLIEGVKLHQNVHLVLRGKDGRIKRNVWVHNECQAAALAHYADQLKGTPAQAKLGWMEVGTGSYAATKLGAYVAGSRTALTAHTATGAVVTYTCTFAATVGTGALTEAGIFNIVTEDTATMGPAANFSVINKGAADSLIITWTLTLADA